MRVFITTENSTEAPNLLFAGGPPSCPAERCAGGEAQSCCRGCLQQPPALTACFLAAEDPCTAQHLAAAPRRSVGAVVPVPSVIAQPAPLPQAPALGHKESSMPLSKKIVC